MSPGDPKLSPRPKAPIAALLATLGLLGLATAAPASVPLSISATAGPPEIALGEPVTVSGRITGEPASIAAQPLQLEAAPYPFHAFRVIDRAQSAADGSFALPAGELQQNTRLRVSLASGAGPAGPVLQVTVDPRVAIHAQSLGPGRVRLSIRIVHARAAGPDGASVFWYLAPRGSQTFSLDGITVASERAPGLTYASVILDPPARRFTYRVCLNPGWEAAMGPASSHGRCPEHDFRLRDGR